MKFKRLFLLLVFAALPSFAAYQQQGFAQFQELDGNIDFVCTGQCFALIGPLVGSDYVSLKGTLQGDGIIGYGFVVGQQITPGETIEIHGGSLIDQTFSFAKSSVYTQIPKEAQVVIIFQGNIVSTQFAVDLGFMDFYQKLGEGWKNFRQMETLTPYSINLRYGVKLLGTSLVTYGYRLFALVMIYILFFVKGDKDKKFRKIFFWGIGIFLFIAIRNAITYIWIVDQGVKTYVTPVMENKTFFDLGDYIPFTDKIRKVLALDTGEKSCKIYVNIPQDWPFRVHWDSLYLRPCTLVLTGSEADYTIYYRTPVVSGDLQKPVLIEYNGNYLLQNK